MGRMIPLNVTPWESWPEWSTPFRSAKARMDSDVTLKPVEAVPGCGRVISFNGRPDWACEYAALRSKDENVVLDVLKWYVGLTEDARAKTMADWLSSVTGAKVLEVQDGN